MTAAHLLTAEAAPAKITLSPEELAAAAEIQQGLYAQNIEALLEQTATAYLNDPNLTLVCASQDEADAYRAILRDKGYPFINTRVANQVPHPATLKPQEWTAGMVRSKADAWRAQQPRHSSEFTKSQPSAQARKKARRQAKAGRKASR